MIMDLLLNYPAEQTLIFDHQGEFAERLHGHPCYSVRDMDACVKQRKAVLFDPRPMFPGFKTVVVNGKEKRVPWGTSEGFSFFCDWSWKVIEREPGVKLFVWDETGTLIPSIGAYNKHSLRIIMENSRNRGCDLACSAQQPNHLNNGIRQQITETFAFRHSDPTAAKWLKEAKGMSLSDLHSLPDGHYIHHSGSTSKLTRGRVALGTK